MSLDAKTKAAYGRLIGAAEILGKRDGAYREVMVLEQAVRRAHTRLEDWARDDFAACDSVEAAIDWLSEDARISDVLENAIAGARQHGEDSEPDHTVGDLQDLLRDVLIHMPPATAMEVLEHEDTMKAVLQAETTPALRT